MAESCLTSSATTAKPRPCSPALAASIAALSASKLVCSEIFFISDRNAGGDFTGSLTELDGYEVANLNLKFDYDHFSASAKVNNLLDEEYNGSASVNFFGAVGFFPAPERNFILTAGYNF